MPHPADSPREASPASRPLRRLGLVLLLLVALGAGGVAWLVASVRGPGPLAEARTVIIAPGGVDDVANDLVTAGVIESPLRFRLAAWLSRSNGRLRAGEYAFPAHASLQQALEILRTTRPVEHRLTIPEGLTAAQIVGLVNGADAATGTVDTIEEGAVLPETYSYPRGTARSALLARARAAMEKELAAAWADRSPELKLASPREVLILASIVERETARPEERPMVAAVYLNRLRLGMRLQADPTVTYAASGGTGVLDRRLSRSDLDRDDPYNTYRYPGLPPGPICAPGSASLRAVTRPAQTDDLFFVADGQGGHVFSRSYDAHERAVARWRSLPVPGAAMQARD
jgi:UPF0755 protein